MAEEAKRKLKEEQDAEEAKLAEQKKIDDFILAYVNSRGRQPLDGEIAEQFK